jgi:hypothetical protein
VSPWQDAAPAAGCESQFGGGFERKETMSVLDSLRKGFGFLLMSFGISRPISKPAPKRVPKPEESK